MFTTLSTICVPITTGLTSSLSLQRDLLITRLEIPLLVTLLSEARPLDGEQDCCLTLPLAPVTVEDDLTIGATGRPLEAEAGRSCIDVLKLGGASRENPGISEGFQGLDFTVGEGPRKGAELFELAGRNFDAEEALPVGADTTGALNEVDGGRVGVADLDVDLEAGREGLAVGVEDRAVDLVGVEDLTGGATFLVEGKEARELGVDDLEGLVVIGNVDRPVGVADLRVTVLGPSDDEGLLLPVVEEFNSEGKVEFLDAIFLLEAGST